MSLLLFIVTAFALPPEVNAFRSCVARGVWEITNAPALDPEVGLHQPTQIDGIFDYMWPVGFTMHCKGDREKFIKVMGPDAKTEAQWILCNAINLSLKNFIPTVKADELTRKSKRCGSWSPR